MEVKDASTNEIITFSYINFDLLLEKENIMLIKNFNFTII